MSFWKGPYGVLVPNHIEAVVASDGGNTRYKSGAETEMGCMFEMNEKLYKEKYAIKKEDGKWYYRDRTQQ